MVDESKIYSGTRDINKTIFQTKSLTSSVTTYHIPSNWIKHGRFNHNKDPYCINIIDTPGFGDTRGLEMEKCINEMIKILYKVLTQSTAFF